MAHSRREAFRYSGVVVACEDCLLRPLGLRDLGFFLSEYFPETFDLPFSPDHERVIAKAQATVLKGGLFALAMPRGSGKTSIIICTAIWALTVQPLLARDRRS